MEEILAFVGEAGGGRRPATAAFGTATNHRGRA
jgi:hypothetical protein